MKTFIWPSAREWWEALRWVLLVFTLLVMLTMAGSFVPYERVVTQGHPWLPHIHCSGCPFCGMTRSFCALSSGHWRDAVRWNRGGPFLYAVGWLWLLCSTAFAARSHWAAIQRLRARVKSRSLEITSPTLPGVVN
jgi:hypothetical protein